MYLCPFIFIKSSQHFAQINPAQPREIFHGAKREKNGKEVENIKAWKKWPLKT